MVLETIHSRDDLLRLTQEEQRTLCAEIRQFLVEHVSRTGGHLASNLGIVETTVAIETVFDTRRDRLVFDVGHQSYVHKILTGRMERFDTLRQYGGIAGFPKPCESECDAFVAGHASNAVSVALGMARARTLRGENYQVAALLGDGALTGGLAYEGLNNAGISREPMVVILNDNGMSITRNVGAISRYLARARLRPKYIGFKLWYRKATAKTAAGRKFYELTHKVKERMRRSLLGTTLFETLGFTYLGPVDGHDVEKVTEILRTAVALHEPVIVHLITQKGKGYVSNSTFENRITRLRPMPGDVLYSREGAILGIACIIPKGLEVCLGQRMMLLRTGQNLNNKFLMHYLNSPFLNSVITENIGGSASPHINVGDIKKFLIPVPDINEQDQTVQIIESRLSVCESIEQTVDTALAQADAMRQSILKQAFEGGVV